MEDRINELISLVTNLKARVSELEIENKKLKAEVGHYATLKYVPKEDIFGILSYFKKYEKNYEISFSGGGSQNPERSFPCLTNYLGYCNTSYYSNSKNGPKSNTSIENSYIQFDFGAFFKIELTSYFIRSYGNGPNTSYHPRTWKILGSNDLYSWKLLDSKIDDTHLNDDYASYNFECNTNDCNTNDCENKYRYIRYLQLDNYSDNKIYPNNPYNILICNFELFGKIYRSI